MLDSEKVLSLRNLIRDSFRVREDHDPIYVDVGGNLIRFSSAQQQVLFGRRGSGKSCLLVHFLRNSQSHRETVAVYVGVDEVKRLGFPDVLIRILLTIFDRVPGNRFSLFGFWKSPLRRTVEELKRLLDEPDTASVIRRETVEQNESANVGSSAGKIGL